MTKINILDKNTYNKIAAGEVVERPSSVVKELIENSIDANATKIDIEIENGGKSLIKITDDGCGIESDQLKTALLAHATSKIKTAEDIDSVLTLGFRGEAIPSIASVSKLKIISKPKDQKDAYSIECNGGENGYFGINGGSDGTTVIVKDLFFNVPARLKFLKTDKSEESEIISMVSKLMLANPDIAFTLTVNGKNILQTYGDGLESCMVVIYGAKIIDDCFYIETIKNGLKFTGYIGKHYLSKPNSTYQSLFINGRYVNNSTIKSAITNAYAPYMMKRQYPFFVLSIQMPTEIVDVNVHPAKAEVRFINNQIIYGSVFSVVSHVLDGTSKALDIVKNSSIDEITKDKKLSDEIIKEYVKHNDFSEFKKQQYSMRTLEVNDNLGAKSLIDLDFDKPKEPIEDIFAENKAYLERQQKLQESKTVEEQKINLGIVNDLTYIGTALSTYLIFQSGDNLYFVDQHAAHERILYDKFRSTIGSSIAQPLLVPYVFTVNSTEYQNIVDKLDEINSIGIEISEFGNNSFKVSAVPTVLDNIDLKLFFDSILQENNQFKATDLKDVIKDKLATMACRAAIKAGDKLEKSDVDTLIELMKNDMGLRCPHGRPVACLISKTEIEKWFKRIV